MTIEEVTDPVEAARIIAQLEKARRNCEWLSAHWPDLLPQARGRYVAVAGQEAYIAETAQEGWEWANRTHPDDEGALVQFVLAPAGARLYGPQYGGVLFLPPGTNLTVEFD